MSSLFSPEDIEIFKFIAIGLIIVAIEIGIYLGLRKAISWKDKRKAKASSK